MGSLQSRINLCTRIQWVMGIGLAMALAVFYAAGYRPALRELATLNMQMDSGQRELEANQSKAKNLPILALQVQQLESKVQTYDRQFPRQPELGQFIRDITQISQQLSLQNWKYQPGAPKRSQTFYELPIQMTFQGDFQNVASFLRQVEDMQRLTRVLRLSVKTKDSTSGIVDVELALSIYFSEG